MSSISTEEPYSRTLKAGLSYSEGFRLEPRSTDPADAVDLTDWTGLMQLRVEIESPVVLELTTSNGGLTIEGLDVVFYNFGPSDTDTDTSNLLGRYISDIILTSPDNVDKVSIVDLAFKFIKPVSRS